MEKVEIEKLENELSQARTNLASERLDMSFGEIMNIYQDGDILISPEFQRLYRWSNYQKTRFIESILLGIPVPPIFVAEDENGKWELVDGLQRLSTILSFFGILKNNDLEFDKEKNNWKLEGSEFIKFFNEKAISKDDLSPKLQIFIKRSVCRIEILRWDSNNNNTLKYELFNRLNTGGSSLTEQEIRNCIFRGTSSTFNKFLKKLSKNEVLNNLILPTKNQKETLYLEELVLRFIALYYAAKEEHIETEHIKKNISKYMTYFMEKNVKDEKFPYNEFENIFDRTLTLLNDFGYKLFRNEIGPFSSGIYDIIIIGVSYYIDYYEKNIETLKNKVQGLKQSEEFSAISGIKVSSKERNSKRIELAKSFFKPE